MEPKGSCIAARLRCKKRKMEVELDWNSFFLNALQTDPKLEYKENNPSFSYSENGVDLEVTEEEQQRYITFLTRIPHIYTKIKGWPSPRQQMLVLAVAACVSQNETIFLKVHASGAYTALVKMSLVSETLVKIRYLDMLCAFFEHDSGLRWSLDTNHWIDVYKVVLECQAVSSCVAEKVHNILSKILQKTSKVAPKVCSHITKQMVQTLTQTAHHHLGKMDVITESKSNQLLPYIVCLVECLERLLASPVTDTLRYFIKLGVQEASTTMALLSHDSHFSLQINKILIILSFYEMTELFDGIKVVNHDPIALSGFLKIIERELKKGHLEAIFELFYYAQKYWKNVSRKMPQYFVKGKAIDIEDELMSFQVEPLVIIAEKLLGMPQTCEEEVRNCYLADVLNVYSTEGLQLGYEIREKLNLAPLNIEIAALKCIVKSKSMYSRKNLAIVFQALTYALRDFLKYAAKGKQEIDQDQNFALMLLEAILVYLENFDLSWRESIGSVELTNLVYEFLLLTSEWNPQVVLKALQTLNITISKHMCPNMALLVDSTQSSTLNHLGAMLYKKCHNTNSEVRNAALTVVCTICQKVNQGFTSFKQILNECLTPALILTMSHSDPDWSVRSTALKSLQEMILMEEIGPSLLETGFVDQILKIASTEQSSPSVLKETINLLSKIYQSECYSGGAKIYNIMVQVVLRGPGEVQDEAVKFWEGVARKQLEKQGMSDDQFPAVIFSKEHRKIIRMDDKEIRKRLFQALDQMSKSGCLGVFQHYLQSDSTPKPVQSTTVAVVTKLLRLLQRYEVTPEFILFNQTYPNLWSITGSLVQSPSSMEEDENMKEIIEETLMEMFNAENNSFGDEVPKSNLQGVEGEFTGSQVSTVDFMDFIYRKLPHLVN